MSARGSGEKPSIVVLHSINFEESWTKQTYLDIERKFGEEGFTVKAIPLQIPGIRTMEGFQEKKKTLYMEQKKSGTVVKPHKVGRNDPCPCGSGKKYKHCCGR